MKSLILILFVVLVIVAVAIVKKVNGKYNVKIREIKDLPYGFYVKNGYVYSYFSGSKLKINSKLKKNDIQAFDISYYGFSWGIDNCILKIRMRDKYKAIARSICAYAWRCSIYEKYDKNSSLKNRLVNFGDIDELGYVYASVTSLSENNLTRNTITLMILVFNFEKSSYEEYLDINATGKGYCKLEKFSDNYISNSSFQYTSQEQKYHKVLELLYTRL